MSSDAAHRIDTGGLKCVRDVSFVQMIGHTVAQFDSCPYSFDRIHCYAFGVEVRRCRSQLC